MRLELLKEARERFAAVPEADVEMARWFHTCGTPACFLGWCSTWWPDELKQRGNWIERMIDKGNGCVEVLDGERAAADFFDAPLAHMQMIVFACDQASCLKRLDTLIAEGESQAAEGVAER